MASKKGKGKFDQPPKIDSAEFPKGAARVKESLLSKLAVWGVNQKDVEHSMKLVDKAIAEIETRAVAYNTAKPKTRESIEKQLRNLQKKLSGEISMQVEEAAKEVLSSKGGATIPAAAPAPAEAVAAPEPEVVPPVEPPAPVVAPEAISIPEPEAAAVVPPMPVVPEPPAPEQPVVAAQPEPEPMGPPAPPSVASEDTPRAAKEQVERKPREKRASAKFNKTAPAAESDPATYAGKVDKIYFELAQRLRKIGVEPNDLPEEWGAAVKAREAVLDLSKRYEKETHKVRRTELADHMRRFAKNLMGTITDKAEKAAEEYRKTHKKPSVPQRLSNKETRDVISEALDHLPATPEAPVVPPQTSGEPPEKNSPSAYSGKLAELENAYHTRYPDGKDIPPEVSEKYFALTKAGLGSMFSTDTASAAKAEETEAEIEALIAKLSVPPMPVVPPPAAGAEDQTVQAKEPEVDASEFAAPQYAGREMQEDMDVLNEPNVFRKNRERLIPTLKDAVETSQPAQTSEPFVAPGPDSPYEASGNSRRAMYSRLDGVSPERAEAILAGGGPAPLEQEATRAETKNRLGGLIEKLTKMGGAVSEGFSKSKNYLNERAKQIDAQAETSGAERITRRMGEIYNKLNWREKFGIGLVLGASAVVTGGASIYLPYAFVGLIGVQRAFGMASMYLSQEKALQNAKIAESGQLISVKERAAFDAVMSGALMGAAIGKGIQLANEYGLVERTREWLGSLMGHTATMPEVAAPARPSGGLPTSPDAVPPPAGGAAAAAAGEAAGKAGEAVAAAPEVAAVEMPSVEAKAGDGYERMLKNLWEQTKGTTYPEGSDMARLQGIDPKDLSAEIHRLATDNEFFKATGESVRINIGDKLSVDANGDLWLNDQTILAPEGAPTTPALNPEVAPAASDASMRVEPSPDFPNEVTRVDADDMTGDIEIPSAAEETSEPAPTDMPANTDVSSETKSPAPVVEKSIITNQFGLAIPVAEPHIYAGADSANTFVFGGSSAERAKTILEYLTANPNKVVFSADDSEKYRIPWHLVGGKVTPGVPMRTGGLFGFFSGFMKAPDPSEFQKLIK